MRPITRSVPLMMKVPFSVHQRDLAEETSCSLNVAHALDPGLGILGIYGQPDVTFSGAA